MAVQGAQRWTEAEDALIRETMPRTREEVGKAARKLGRTPDAIRNRVRRYQQEPIAPRWTPEQDRALLAAHITPHDEKYTEQSAIAELAAKFGRSVGACYTRYDMLIREAGHRGGKWTREGLWTEGEEATIIRAFAPHRHKRAVPNGTWVDVGQVLGRSPSAVKMRAIKLRKEGRLYGTYP